MDRWKDCNERLDATRIYLVGENEWAEMMEALYCAAAAALSIEVYDVALPIIEMMEREISLLDTVPSLYAEEIAERRAIYRFGEPLPDDVVEPRFKNWD